MYAAWYTFVVCHGGSGKGYGMDEEILTLADVAIMLRKTEDEVARLLESGALPGRRIGDAWYVSKRKLIAFIEEDAPAQASGPVPAAHTQMKAAGPDNAWRCDYCEATNDPERVQCHSCARPRLIPLINYRRRL